MEEKRKKIKKAIKISCYVIMTLIIILGFAACIKTKAAEPNISYLNYTGIISVNSSTNNNGTYEGDFTLLARIQNNEIKWIYNANYIDKNFECQESDLLSGPYETYGTNSIDNTKIYLVYTDTGYQDYEEAVIYIKGASEINTFYQYFYGEYWQNGYGSGISDQNIDIDGAYQNGYNFGYQQAQNRMQQNYNDTIQTMKTQYENGIKGLQDEIDRLTEIVNENNTTWGSYKSLLGIVMIYPIQLFKEGLNVEIFGVNVGGFILGLGVLLILLTILGVIFGRGGKKE